MPDHAATDIIAQIKAVATTLSDRVYLSNIEGRRTWPFCTVEMIAVLDTVHTWTAPQAAPCHMLYRVHWYTLTQSATLANPTPVDGLSQALTIEGEVLDALHKFTSNRILSCLPTGGAVDRGEEVRDRHHWSMDFEVWHTMDQSTKT